MLGYSYSAFAFGSSSFVSTRVQRLDALGQTVGNPIVLKAGTTDSGFCGGVGLIALPQARFMAVYSKATSSGPRLVSRIFDPGGKPRPEVIVGLSQASNNLIDRGPQVAGNTAAGGFLAVMEDWSDAPRLWLLDLQGRRLLGPVLLTTHVTAHGHSLIRLANGQFVASWEFLTEQDTSSAFFKRFTATPA